MISQAAMARMLRKAVVPAVVFSLVGGTVIGGPASAGDGCTIKGTSGDDILVGTAEADRICGFRGDDVIYGRDHLDVLKGGRGDDLLFGGGDPDDLYGGRGSDVARGGPGFDFLLDRSGKDFLSGDSGDDCLFVDDGTANDTVNGGSDLDNDLYQADPGDTVRQAELKSDNCPVIN